LRELLLQDGVPKEQMGDVVRHQDGMSVITMDPPHPATVSRKNVGSVEIDPMIVGLELVRRGKSSTKTVVVPSMRADALGAKAFGVSRTYFGKGVAGGKVYLNGAVASKSTVVGLADELYADGVGRFVVQASRRCRPFRGAGY
jgi:RNA-binding protein YlmH